MVQLLALDFELIVLNIPSKFETFSSFCMNSIKPYQAFIGFKNSSTFDDIVCILVESLFLLSHFNTIFTSIPNEAIKISNFEIKMPVMFVLRCTVAVLLIPTNKVEGSCSNK